MIEESALVVECQDEYAWVETQRKSTCSSCSASKGCGTGALSKVLGNKTARMRVLNRIGARVGEEVIVGVSEGALVQGSLAVYIVPLLGLFLFALLGQALASQLEFESTESLSIVFGLIGLALGAFWVRRFSVKISQDPRYQPVIVRRVSQGHTLSRLA